MPPLLGQSTCSKFLFFTINLKLGSKSALCTISEIEPASTVI